jgi:hypothetical protein
MSTNLEAMRAVRNSQLPPPARHLMMTLISLANPSTCVIPDSHTPSLTDLTNFTGMVRSTVATHLNTLETEGWLKRDKPSTPQSWGAKVKTRYFVQIPTSPGDGLVQETDRSVERTSPGDGPELVRENDTTSPSPGPVVPNPIHTNQKSSSPPRAAKRKPKPEPRRDDVEHLCALLADRIEQNGSPHPNVTDAWRKQCRLLLDDKKRTPRLTVEKVAALIEWSQQDAFWKSNIRSMEKFRSQYDTLRLRALAEWENGKHSTDNGRSDHTGPYRDDDRNANWAEGGV